MDGRLREAVAKACYAKVCTEASPTWENLDPDGRDYWREWIEDVYNVIKELE